MFSSFKIQDLSSFSPQTAAPNKNINKENIPPHNAEIPSQPKRVKFLENAFLNFDQKGELQKISKSSFREYFSARNRHTSTLNSYLNLSEFQHDILDFENLKFENCIIVLPRRHTDILVDNASFSNCTFFVNKTFGIRKLPVKNFQNCRFVGFKAFLRDANPFAHIPSNRVHVVSPQDPFHHLHTHGNVSQELHQMAHKIYNIDFQALTLSDARFLAGCAEQSIISKKIAQMFATSQFPEKFVRSVAIFNPSLATRLVKISLDPNFEGNKDGIKFPQVKNLYIILSELAAITQAKGQDCTKLKLTIAQIDEYFIRIYNQTLTSYITSSREASPSLKELSGFLLYSGSLAYLRLADANTADAQSFFANLPESENNLVVEVAAKALFAQNHSLLLAAMSHISMRSEPEIRQLYCRFTQAGYTTSHPHTAAISAYAALLKLKDSAQNHYDATTLENLANGYYAYICQTSPDLRNALLVYSVFHNHSNLTTFHNGCLLFPISALSQNLSKSAQIQTCLDNNWSFFEFITDSEFRHFAQIEIGNAKISQFFVDDLMNFATHSAPGR